jgi:DNA (cytosine-5)-methyltransferase 1
MTPPASQLESRLTVGSLFCGIGGFDLGLERTGGFEVRWQVEIDAYCQRVLAKHWPHVKRYGDIRTVTDVERVDVLCGGFPCQDISNAGKQAGIEGARSGLWSEYVRLIRLVRPKYVIVENVAALLGRGMGRVLGDLFESGYDAEWDCLPAEAFGAPHERDRLYLVAYAHEGHAEGIRAHQQSPSREVAEDHEAFQAANTRSQRVQRIFTKEIPRLSGFSWCENVRRLKDLRGRSDIPEPIIRGDGHGFSARVDRSRGLGNAVLPGIVEWIGNRILDDSHPANFDRKGET